MLKGENGTAGRGGEEISMTEPVIIGEHRYSASPQPEDFVLHTHDTYEIL